jgi:MFS family permease
VITALCLAAILAIALCAQVFPSFLTRIGGSAGEQGLLLFSMFLLYPASSLAAGIAADRVGKRAVLGAGLACLAATFALSAAVPDIRVRTLAVLLFGLGEGVVESQATALLSDLSPARERSMLSWSQLMFSAGAAGGPFLLALLFSLHTGATLAAVLWACSALCAAPALGFMLHIGRDSAAPATPRARAAVPAPPQTVQRSMFPLRKYEIPPPQHAQQETAEAGGVSSRAPRPRRGGRQPAPGDICRLALFQEESEVPLVGADSSFQGS